MRIKYLKIFEDFPWENVPASLWSVGELTSALTCACLPTLRPLVRRYFPSLDPTQRGTFLPTHESAHGPSAGRSRVYRDPSNVDSRSGSEVELAQAKGNPFEVQVVREVRVGVEAGHSCDNRGEMGVTGTISPPPPASPERPRSKAFRR